MSTHRLDTEPHDAAASSAVPDHLRSRPDKAFLTPAELAERLACSERRLSEMRRAGNGPPFVRTGNRPLYPTKLLLAWEERRVMASTSAA